MDTWTSTSRKSASRAAEQLLADPDAVALHLAALATLTIEQWPTCDWAEERSALAAMYPTVGLAANAVKQHPCFKGVIDVPLTRADVRTLSSAAEDD